MKLDKSNVIFVKFQSWVQSMGFVLVVENNRSCRGCIKTIEYDDENDDEDDEMGNDGFVLVLVLELVLENSRSCRGCSKTVEYDDENNKKNDDDEGGGTCRARHLRTEPMNP